MHSLTSEERPRIAVFFVRLRVRRVMLSCRRGSTVERISKAWLGESLRAEDVAYLILFVERWSFLSSDSIIFFLALHLLCRSFAASLLRFVRSSWLSFDGAIAPARFKGNSKEGRWGNKILLRYQYDTWLRFLDLARKIYGEMMLNKRIGLLARCETPRMDCVGRILKI